MSVYVQNEQIKPKGCQNLRKLIAGVKSSNLNAKGLRILLSLSEKELADAERELEKLEREIANLYGE